MVGFSDLKVYRSTSDLGGAITGTQIATATPNNLFTSVPRADYTTGKTYYKCMYWKNTHATESMDDFILWISGGTPPANTTINFAFDPIYNPYYGVISFDGTDDRIDCTNDGDLWSKALTKFSFSTWIFPTRDGVGLSNTEIVTHGSTTAQAFRCHLPNNANRITFSIRNAAGSAVDAFSDSLVINQWNHVVCVYDNSLGSANIKIYLNGVLGGTTANLTESINLSATLFLGNSSTDFQGYMRDFKFWDTTALSSTQVTEEYNGTGTISPSYNLPMNERTGNPVDSVSGTKVGTLQNGAAWTTAAQTIANQNTSPVGVTWMGSGVIPASLGKIVASQSFPTWQRLVVNATATADPIENDSGIFTARFDIPQTGTGSPGDSGSGGGTGGNPSTVTDYKIAFAGDWGCEPETDDVIDLMLDQDYDACIGVGDNAYESPDCWINRFKPIRTAMKFKSAYGNHEYEESQGKSPYMSFFGDSKTWYSFQWRNILFLIIDSNDDKSGVDLDEQRAAFASVLEQKKNDSSITWRIAVIHHPWFGTGSKHPSNEFNQVQKFHKLFTDYRISFVYTGHNHNWHRSHQVGYNSSNPKSPSIVDSSSPYSRNVSGLIHVVTGTGGHDSGGGLYSLYDSASFWAYRNNTHNGVHELVSSNNGQTLTGRFRDTGGDIHDTFVINA